MNLALNPDLQSTVYYETYCVSRCCTRECIVFAYSSCVLEVGYRVLRMALLGSIGLGQLAEVVDFGARTLQHLLLSGS